MPHILISYVRKLKPSIATRSHFLISDPLTDALLVFPSYVVCVTGNHFLHPLHLCAGWAMCLIPKPPWASSESQVTWASPLLVPEVTKWQRQRITLSAGGPAWAANQEAQTGGSFWSDLLRFTFLWIFRIDLKMPKRVCHMGGGLYSVTACPDGWRVSSDLDWWKCVYPCGPINQVFATPRPCLCCGAGSRFCLFSLLPWS